MMPRAFVDTEVTLGQNVTISGEDGHHYARVLRVREGEPMAVASRGTGYLGEVVHVDSKSAFIQIRIHKPLPSHESRYPVYLIQGMAKGDKIDAVIQHNTELGVAGFLLFESNRSVAKVDARKQETKLARWQKVAREAASQSQRDFIPEVSFASTLKEVGNWLRSTESRVLCFLDEDEQTASLHTVLECVSQNGSDHPVTLVVGPEGGWDESERVAWKAQFDAHTVTLGPRTLRTETAGMVAASAVLHHFRQLGG